MSSDPFQDYDDAPDGIVEDFAPPLTGEPRGPRSVEAYDLTRAQIGRASKPGTLAIIEERVANLLSTELERLLRVRVRIDLSETYSVRWSDHLDTCAHGGCYNFLELDALGGYGQLEFELATVFRFLDRLLGGPGTDVDDAHGRTRFSKVEERVIRRFVHLFARAFEDAWRPVLPMTVRHVRVETKASNAAPASMNDWVLVQDMQIFTDDLPMGGVKLVLPVSLLEPYKEELANGSYDKRNREPDDWDENFRVLVPGVPVDVVAELGRQTVTLGDILDWKVDDVIRLDQAAERPIKVSLAGVPKYLGDITVQFGNLAVQLRSIAGRRGARPHGLHEEEHHD